MIRKILLIIILFAFSQPGYGHDLGDGAHISTIFTESPNKAGEYIISWTLEITLQELLGQYPEYDIDENGRLTPIEYGAIDARKVAEYVQQHIALTSDDMPCQLEIKRYDIVTHKRADYIQFPLLINCGSSSRSLQINYDLFFDQNPYHQGTWTIVLNNLPTMLYFWEDERERIFSIREYSSLEIAKNFFFKGVHHIAIGFDHILFLVSLLLTAVLVRREGHWQGTEKATSALWNMAKIITAFTLAHSVTLSLAVLNLVPLPPSALVESIIATSVFVMALNNVVHFIGRVYLVTFIFGLIHGFGFANVLLDYDLPSLELSLSLVSFNLGVEVGQLLIAGFVFGLLVKYRDSLLYRNKLMPALSIIIMVIAVVWIYQRVFL